MPMGQIIASTLALSTPASLSRRSKRARLVALPITPANYESIQTAGEKIYYLRTTVGDEPADDSAGPDSGPGRVLAFYDLKERKETELGRRVDCDLGIRFFGQGTDFAFDR